MTLDELKQIKQDVSNGIVISRATWLKVLNMAIHAMEDGEIGMVSEVDGKLDIYPIVISHMGERFVDRLKRGAMVVAPGTFLAKVKS